MRDLLLGWDPIGVAGSDAAADEYDFMISPLMHLLHDGADREAIARWIASQRDYMGLGRLLDLNRLDRAHIHYELAHTRPDSVMIDVAVPGWRWEIEFMADGSLDIERYRSVSGVENDSTLLEDLFRDSDDAM